MLKIIYYMISGILFIGISTPLSYAYSTFIHRKSAKWIYTTLPAKTQHTIKDSINALPHPIFPKDFAHLAETLDHTKMRKLSVAEIFKQAYIPLPQPLKPYADIPSSKLHYITLPLKTSSSCQAIFNKKNKIKIQFLQTLIQLYPLYAHPVSTQDKKTQAILLMFISHLVVDFHTPTHMLSSIKYCTKTHIETDLGGNKTCLIQGPTKCVENLHHFWDHAGYDILWSLPQKSINRELLYTKQVWAFRPSVFYHGKNKNPVQRWIQHMKNLHNVVYNQDINIPPVYKMRVQTLSRMLITLGNIQLAEIIS